MQPLLQWLFSRRYFPVLFGSELFNNKLVQEGVRKGLGWCSFAEMFILSCGIAVLQNQVVCGILKFFW